MRDHKANIKMKLLNYQKITSDQNPNDAEWWNKRGVIANETLKISIIKEK